MVSMMAGRQRRHKRHAGRPPMGESLLTYRILVNLMIAFCTVAMLSLASHAFRVNPSKGGGREGYISSSSLSSSSSTALRSKMSGGSNQQGNDRTVFQSTQNISDDVLVQFDAILVLGGGRPHTIDEPPVYVQRRCDDAAVLVTRHQALMKQQQQQQQQQKHGAAKSKTKPSPTLPILCLSAGTAHVPQLLSADGLPVYESTASAAYLAKRYPHLFVNDDNDNNKQSTSAPAGLFVETTSYDTIGNAYFARTSHTDVNGWRNLLIITNEFHMTRTVAIFDWIFGLSSSSSPSWSPYRLYYLASPDVGLTVEALQARHEREAASLENVHNYARTYNTDLAQVYYQFLMTQHGLYAATKLVERGSAKAAHSETNDLVKKSYGAVIMDADESSGD